MRIILGVIFVAIILSLCVFVMYKRRRQESFENLDNNNDIYCVLFWAKWCPHCTAMKSDWEKLTKKYDGKQINGKRCHIVSAEESDAHTAEYRKKCPTKIPGFPTIMLVNNGKWNEYAGGRNFASFESFIKST
tara:strand:+ start:900 stop:1298 length:399 start_codon:yes stop_codon:yes gene_type:complete